MFVPRIIFIVTVFCSFVFVVVHLFVLLLISFVVVHLFVLLLISFVCLCFCCFLQQTECENSLSFFFFFFLAGEKERKKV